MKILVKYLPLFLSDEIFIINLKKYSNRKFPNSEALAEPNGSIDCWWRDCWCICCILDKIFKSKY